jgi:type II secretory pathway pseudopilin PulG
VVRGEAGASLLEAMIALVVLGTAGTATAGLVGQVTRSVENAHRREAELRSANAFLEAVSLWSREDLDRRLGTRQQGPYLLRVDRPEPTLYLLVLSDTLGSDLLRTSIFRPEPSGGM